MKITIDISKDIILILRNEYPNITKEQISKIIELFIEQQTQTYYQFIDWINENSDDINDIIQP